MIFIVLLLVIIGACLESFLEVYHLAHRSIEKSWRGGALRASLLFFFSAAIRHWNTEWSLPVLGLSVGVLSLSLGMTVADRYLRWLVTKQ